jgi:hypothetical protein
MSLVDSQIIVVHPFTYNIMIDVMDLFAIAIPWRIIGAAGGNYRMKKKREQGMKPMR